MIRPHSALPRRLALALVVLAFAATATSCHAFLHGAHFFHHRHHKVHVHHHGPPRGKVVRQPRAWRRVPRRR